MENNDTLEVIQRIPLDKLRPYPDHPFGVRDDDMMQQTVESIKQFGVLVPGIARPLPDGSFELIAGHRRKQASAIAVSPICPSSSATLTATLQLSLWWTATFSEKTSSPARKQRLTK